MISSTTSEFHYEFDGKFTDTKPIGSNCTNANVSFPIDNGSTFLETNATTGELKVYKYLLTATTTEGVTTLSGAWVELQ